MKRLACPDCGSPDNIVGWKAWEVTIPLRYVGDPSDAQAEDIDDWSYPDHKLVSGWTDGLRKPDGIQCECGWIRDGSDAAKYLVAYTGEHLEAN